LTILKHVGDIKQAAHVTFYSLLRALIPVSSIVGALQSTHTLVLNAMLVPRCTCNERRMCETWYAEITSGCDMLNGKATNCIELVKLFDSCACFYKYCVGVLYFE